MDDRERDNLVRYDGERRGFFEVYYLKLNDRRSGTALWIRYTLTSPEARVGTPYCELWGVFFDGNDPGAHFGLKRRMPIESLRFDTNRFELEMDGAELSESRARGALEDPARGLALSWDLHFDSNEDTLRHFPAEVLYRWPFPKTKVLSPHVDARFHGAFVASGRTIELAGAPGQQSHLWGTEHALRWVWGHCNDFDGGEDVVFEGLASQIALGPVRSPPLKLFFLRYRGRWHRMNGVSRWLLNRSEHDVGVWRFVARGDNLVLTGSMRAPLADTLAVTYRDPDDRPLWCHNTELADCELHLSDFAGRKLGRLSCARSAAMELVERRLHPEVPLWI